MKKHKTGLSPIERIKIYSKVKLLIIDGKHKALCYPLMLETPFYKEESEVRYKGLKSIYPELKEVEPLEHGRYWWPENDLSLRIKALDAMILSAFRKFFTRKQKLFVMKFAKKRLEEEKCSYICMSILHYFDDIYLEKELNDHLFSIFPELLKYKPSRLNESDLWWNHGEYKTRIKVVKKLIFRYRLDVIPKLERIFILAIFAGILLEVVTLVFLGSWLWYIPVSVVLWIIIAYVIAKRTAKREDYL